MQHYAIIGVSGNSPVLDPSDLHHATKVMRMKPEDQFVAIWQNARHLCVIEAIAPFHAVFTGQILPSNEPPVQLLVLLSVIKPTNFELAVQKCVEAGVNSIRPVISFRSQHYELNLPRLQRIAKEAAEQSHRDYVPIIEKPLKLEDAVRSLQGAKCLLDLSFSKTCVAFSCEASLNRALVIGPEGGWEKQELDLMVEIGFTGCTLGKTVLRAETAAIVGAHVLCWSAKDF